MPRTQLNPLLLALLLAALPPRSPAQVTPAPIVNEPGRSSGPATSADGLRLAYSSDRDGSGFLHLWIQPLAGGDARRLTDGAADDHEPSFAPDGATLAYRSEGNGGGVYLVATEGGRPRMLAPQGRRPRFAPAGGSVAYWVAAKAGSGSHDAMFAIDAAGGRPHALHPEFHSARAPTWSPDGRYVLFAGCRDGSEESCDWWVSPARGGDAVATGAAKILRQARLDASAPPDLWLRPGGGIVFGSKRGEKNQLWILDLMPDPWRVAGPPRRLTSGEDEEAGAAQAPDGRIVFGRPRENIDIWSLPLQANQAKPAGALTRLTSHPSIDQRPSLSLDGRRMAWETSRGGNFEVWVKDLASGQEKGLTSGPLREHMPALSRDGSRLVYDAHDGEKVTVFQTGFDGGEPVKVWEENVGQGSFQWTRKGDAILYFHREPPGSVGLMNLSSKKRTVLLRHPSRNLSLADARLSPDNRWIAFPVPSVGHRSRLAVARLTGTVIEDERDWIYVTPEQHNASQPEWSPNGGWLYFLSGQNGRLAVWALPLSAAKKPQGEARLILDIGDGRLSIAAMRPRDIGLTVARDKLALAVTESSGSLWLAESR
ncbi:MAG: PD40 domain-containing protein [Acidobacteriia bacterium]|nr:PD40 domain-containing protein [Terriglobia bacterium]